MDRKETRDEYVVNWYLFCPGRGNCVRKCGGIGRCVRSKAFYNFKLLYILFVHLLYMPKIKSVVFPLSRPTLFQSADPTDYEKEKKEIGF